MSDNWWDPISAAADWVGSKIGDAASSAGQYLGDAAGNVGSALADYGGQALGAITPSSESTNLFAGDSPGNYSNMGGTALGAVPDVASTAGTMGGTFESGAAPAGLDVAANGTGLQAAADWAKKNPSLVNQGIQAGLTLGRQTSPAAATTAGYNAAVAGNTAKAAVGSSMINQAPFLANNAEAASKNAGANASSALSQRLNQQGYKPGDAMYESMMQQQNLGNRQNDATAYGTGAAQTASQEATGAGLMTPTNLSSYDSLGSQQNAQQGAQNKQAADTAGLAKTAFDIWSNPDKKTDSTTDN